jgi:hypothetical protein
MKTDLINYAIAFLLTIVIEVAVAMVLGYRKRPEIACIVWVNVFSHPLLNYIIWTINSLSSVPIGIMWILLFEGCVAIIEWQLMCYALRRIKKSRLLVLSLTMNSASYIAGIVLPVWIY